MPIQPRPWSVHCPKCGWSKRHQPQSDALVAGDIAPQRCPRCGHAPLDSKSPDTLRDVMTSLANIFKPK